MISRHFISQLATRYQTIEENIAREYCQHLFLSYFYKKKGSEKFLFKGGTALRIVFHSPRFSEDLDFSAIGDHGPDYSEINRLIDETLGNMEEEGIQTEKKVNDGTQGETTGGYLTVIKLKMLDFDSEIRLEISFRNPSEVEANTSLVQSEFTDSYVVTFLTERILVKEKIEALLYRKKPRDFFDLYFISKNPSLVSYIPRSEIGLKEKLLNALSEVGNLERELKIFLPVSHQTISKDFSSRLTREIETYFS
ncbi:MAG: nucleotidyl transferase AbiEii/AbiGii toxin family protein [Candidatus Paceibacterota bacterium]|jgi:predicted nucleotidyltransferase component of viral defense system